MSDLRADLRQRALDALGHVIDPELGLDIVALGLVYELVVEGSDITVRLTMTTAACPLGEQIADDAKRALESLDGAERVSVALVWEPPWTPERMSEGARAILGWAPR